MKQTELQLSTADRVVLDGFRKKGVHPAREVNRAHLLMALDSGTAELLEAEVGRWQQQRNAAGRGIEWKFTRPDADRKLGRHYVP